jgi:hypothetical protein
MINPTLQQVIDIGITVGLEPEKSEQWYHYYKAQGWRFSSGLEIVDIKSALYRWKRNQYKFENKQKLYPIKGKICSEKGCGMPAVYKHGRSYDFYKCSDHLPKDVKKKYK